MDSLTVTQVVLVSREQLLINDQDCWLQSC
jgi:hypothetical protein